MNVILIEKILGKEKILLLPEGYNCYQVCTLRYYLNELAEMFNAFNKS
jgi:hypothetical protein